MEDTRNKEEVNFAKICKIVIEVGRDILWDVLTRYKNYAPNNLLQKMKSFPLANITKAATTIEDSMEKNKRLYPSQSDFDVTVLCQIMDHLKSQNVTQANVDKAVKEIRSFRNAMAHFKKASLNDDDYHKMLRDIKNPLMDLEYNTLRTKNRSKIGVPRRYTLRVDRIDRDKIQLTEIMDIMDAFKRCCASAVDTGEIAAIGGVFHLGPKDKFELQMKNITDEISSLEEKETRRREREIEKEGQIQNVTSENEALKKEIERIKNESETLKKDMERQKIESGRDNETLRKEVERLNKEIGRDKLLTEMPADVIFVLDESETINSNDFEKELDFVLGVCDLFDWTEGKNRFGVSTFAGVYTEHIPIQFVTDKNDFRQKVKSIKRKCRHEKSFISAALSGLSFDSVRSLVSRIAFIVTDGKSTIPWLDTLFMTFGSSSSQIKISNGVTIFAIGVGENVNREMLNKIGSKPTCDFVQTVDSFNHLQNIQDTLKNMKSSKFEVEFSDSWMHQ